MSYEDETRKRARRAFVTIVAFVVSSVGVLVFLFTGTPLTVPVLEEARDYRVSALITDVDNLVPAVQVRIAGVEVGEVSEVTRTDQGMRVTMAFDQVVTPLHEGLTVRVGARSAVGETYLEVEDGNGPPVPSGYELTAPGAVAPSTDVRDVVTAVGPRTREQLGSAIRAAGAGTAGTGRDVDELVRGLGTLSRNGTDVLTVIAKQSDDLRALTAETSTLMSALDTGEGDIGNLVSNARRITDATSGQKQALEQSVRILPSVLDSASAATGGLKDLAGALGPVAANLRAAGPPLSDALKQLPATSKDLRGLLPDLDETLDRAPATLQRVPRFADNVQDLIPPTQQILRDVNPILNYLKPYGREGSSFIANFNAILGYTTEDGVHYARLNAQGSDQSVVGPDVTVPSTYRNPYPLPGQGSFPGPFDRTYPRVERAPK